MSKSNRRAYLVCAIVGIACVVAGGTLVAAGPDRIGSFAGDNSPLVVPDTLPTVDRLPMTVTQGIDEAVSVLSFDDGTCESGLGAGVTVSALVDFDVPPQCTTGGLDIVAMTSRMNSGSGQAAVLHQAGAAPGPAGAPGSTVPLAVAATGPCPGAIGPSQAIAPGSLVVTGTANFFAGLQNTGFAARDTNSAPAGRIWLNCATCGMTQYSPAFLSGLALGGNWNIRVSVEDAACVPVELMGFDVE